MAKAKKRLTTEERSMQSTEALKVGAIQSFLGGLGKAKVDRNTIDMHVKDIKHKADCRALRGKR